MSDYYFTPDKLEAYKDGNLLKGGIVFVDAITTVSDTYAEEIKMPFYGEGLDGLMRARSNSLRGIVNGIDYQEFNPATDPLIAQNYDARTFRKEKIKNKRALQAELGLEQDDRKMVIDYLTERVQASAEEIAKALGIRRAKTIAYLEELAAEELVEALGEDPDKIYRLKS